MTRREICDFWIGKFDNSTDYFDFVGENPEFYQDEADIDEKYISKFAKSQRENWIDHDFMESGLENGEESFFERFKKYSYSDQWIKTLSERISETDLSEINTVIFITKGRIKNPISISESNFTLRYIGQIEYTI
ncbi:immunity 22 family protein [Ohtaekwangia kribbensis]|uniref:Immunity 22 family protein n=1 Tax=Ohtaekwangia kribbensis TaxID=688913 RepID=A0ABW3K348_9BACT